MATGSASRSSRFRHRLIAVERSRRSLRARRQPTWSGIGHRVAMPWPYGRRIVRRYAPSRHSSTPDTAVAARCPNRLPGHSGARNGSRSDTVPWSVTGRSRDGAGAGRA